jgi:hypothetical protein
MYFVIAYSRLEGKRLNYEVFHESQHDDAHRLYARLLHEYINEENGNVEVNVFESKSEEDFRETHARYFETMAEAIDSLKRAI